MGPVKRPAPDALEETELFRKVPAAFWGIEVVTDAHFTWWHWRRVHRFVLSSQRLPNFLSFLQFPPFVLVCHDWLTGYTHLTGEGVCE